MTKPGDRTIYGNIVVSDDLEDFLGTIKESDFKWCDGYEKDKIHSVIRNLIVQKRRIFTLKDLFKYHVNERVYNKFHSVEYCLSNAVNSYFMKRFGVPDDFFIYSFEIICPIVRKSQCENEAEWYKFAKRITMFHKVDHVLIQTPIDNQTAKKIYREIKQFMD